MFRRELCNGFQWGMAYDYLHDDYDEKSDLQQLRTESSYVFDGYCGNSVTTAPMAFRRTT